MANIKTTTGKILLDLSTPPLTRRALQVLPLSQFLSFNSVTQSLLPLHACRKIYCQRRNGNLYV